jgi:hypothetical protein
MGPGIPAPDGRKWAAQFGGWTEGLFLSTDGSSRIRVQAQGLFGSARLVGFDAQGNVYLLVEDLYDENPRKLGVELTLRKYSPDGSLLGVVRLPAEEFAMFPGRPVELGPDGRVYVLVPRQKTVSVYAVQLGESYTSKAYRVPLDQPGSMTASPGEVGIAALGRKEVFERARTMANLTWTWRSNYDWFNGEWFSDRQDKARPSAAPKPNQLNLADGATAWGIPYYWGGFDSPWTKSDWAGSRWSSWSGALSYYLNQGKRGPLVGDTDSNCTDIDPDPNKNSCWDNVYPGGAGIDCSGFVAAASGNYYSSKPGTSQLASSGYDWRGSDSTTVALRRLQPMNFLVRTDSNSHTLYYFRRWYDLSKVETLEATTASTPQGAKFYSRYWSDLAAYPYHRAWWPMSSGVSPELALTTSGLWSACYGIAGQAVWFRFTISGPRTVTLTNISGGDPDLYVYDSNFNLKGSSSNGGTSNESVSLSTAGTYYAMVHIWSNTSGGCVYWTISW